MSRDWAEEAATLHDDLAAAAARFEVGGPAAAVSSSDADGPVTVTLDPSGAIRAVHVAARWDGGSAELSRAVRQAAEKATALRTEQWTTAAAEPAPRTALAGPVPTGDGVWSRLSEIADAGGAAANTDVLEALLEMFTTISDGMDQLSEELAAHQTDVYTGSSNSGAAVATLTASGELVGVDFEDEFARTASHTSIGREATEAIAAAQQQAQASSSASIVARSPLGDIAAMANDPAALARRLRLTT